MSTRWSGKANEFVTWLKDLIDGRYRLPAGALITFASVPEKKESMRLVTMRWEFADSPKEPRSSRSYGNLQLMEMWLSIDEAFEALSALVAGKTSLGGITICEKLSWARSDGHNGGSMTGWPEATFSISIDHENRFQLPREPAVMFGRRPYADLAEAINEWVWSESTHKWAGGDPRHKDEVIIAVPDTRARIAHAEWRPGAVDVRLDLNVPPEQIELQGVLRHEVAAEVDDRRTTAPASLVTWDVPSGAKIVDMFLLHEDGTVLGQTSLGAPGQEYEARVGTKTPLELAHEDVRSGEGQYVEFKPFIRPMDEKEGELLRAIVAFSNQKEGGRLYIGVKDDGIPEGFTAHNKAFNSAPDVNMSAAKVWLKKLLRERVKPDPIFEAHALEIFGSPVLAVHVQQGSTPPYATHENDVFIRKGATNRKADPHTELPRLTGGGHTPLRFDGLPLFRGPSY